jgi:hypothetical protein
MNQKANSAIDAITRAMSELSSLELTDDTLGGLAWSHLDDARKLLIAKYQPNES